MQKKKLKVVAKSHHRNGVCGEPFNVYIFDDPEYGLMLGVDWGDTDDSVGFAAFVIERLAKGNIAFGSNSFRGDYYADTVRTAGEKVKDDVAPGSLFLKYEVKKEKNARKATTRNRV